MSLYTKYKSTTIFFVHALFLSYQPVKVYKNNMDNPVSCSEAVLNFKITILTKSLIDSYLLKRLEVRYYRWERPSIMRLPRLETRPGWD